MVDNMTPVIIGWALNLVGWGMIVVELCDNHHTFWPLVPFFLSLIFMRMAWRRS